MGWLWTPFAVTLQPRKDATRGGPANNGSEDTLSPGTFNVFIEARDTQWAAERGVMTENQPHLVIGYPNDMRLIVMGDLIQWGDRVLKVENRPVIYDYGDGYPSAELIATDQTSGGRNR